MAVVRIFQNEREWQEFYDKIKLTHTIMKIPDEKNPGSAKISIKRVYPGGDDATIVDGYYYLRGVKK